MENDEISLNRLTFLKICDILHSKDILYSPFGGFFTLRILPFESWQLRDGFAAGWGTKRGF